METLLMSITGAMLLILLIFFLALVWEELTDFINRRWNTENRDKWFTNRFFKRFSSLRH